MKSIEDFEIIGHRKGFDGFSSIDVYTLRYRQYDGSWSHIIEREIHHRASTVAVILYDPTKDRIAMVEQFRPAAAIAGRPAWQLEIVAGMIGDGEAVEAVARKETLEEAGCEKVTLIPIYEFFPSPGESNDRTHLYCGVVNSSELGGIHGIIHEGENTCVCVFEFSEVIKFLAEGKIENATSIVAVQWLALNRHLLQESRSSE